jgi:hypothetical protein
MEHLNAGSEATSEELDQALARAVRQFIAEAADADPADAEPPGVETAARAAALLGERSAEISHPSRR